MGATSLWPSPTSTLTSPTSRPLMLAFPFPNSPTPSHHRISAPVYSTLFQGPAHSRSQKMPVVMNEEGKGPASPERTFQRPWEECRCHCRSITCADHSGDRVLAFQPHKTKSSDNPENRVHTLPKPLLLAEEGGHAIKADLHAHQKEAQGGQTSVSTAAASGSGGEESAGPVRLLALPLASVGAWASQFSNLENVIRHIY